MDSEFDRSIFVPHCANTTGKPDYSSIQMLDFSPDFEWFGLQIVTENGAHSGLVLKMKNRSKMHK